MRLFDAHCHLQDPRIAHCLSELLHDTADQNIQQFGCNGTCEDDWPKVAQLAIERSNIKPNFGLHPWCLEGRSQNWLENLRKLLQATPHAGLGECGLDGSKKVQTPLKEQTQVFEAQLQLGQELQRPISEILQQYAPFPKGLILHSWMGPAEMVDSLAKLQGVYFSLSGHLTCMSKKKYEPMVKKIPLERLLLETDAPDGKPRLGNPYEEKLVDLQAQSSSSEQDLNHPVNISVMLDLLADIRDEGTERIADAAFANAARLFMLEQPAKK